MEVNFEGRGKKNTEALELAVNKPDTAQMHVLFEKAELCVLLSHGPCASLDP